MRLNPGARFKKKTYYDNLSQFELVADAPCRYSGYQIQAIVILISRQSVGSSPAGVLMQDN